MSITRTFSVIGVGLIFFVCTAGQTSVVTESKTSSGNSITSRSGQRKVANAERKQIQSQARSLLISLASDVASFSDQTLRVRCLARIADVLWTVDMDQGKTLFRKAWEAAQAADRSDTPFNLGESAPNLRQEVLQLATRHDRLLTEEFLKKLQVEESAEIDDSTNNASGSKDVLTQRLLLANQLLRDGDTKGALKVAAPVLGNIRVNTIEFLTNLRTKDPAAADSSYMALLVAPRAGMDSNTISLLSSYLFTPHVYVTFNAEGGADRMGFSPSSPPIDVEPRVRVAFFQAAGEVLLRVQARSEQEGTSGVIGNYMMLKHLLPLFEAYAPAELSQTIRAELEALAPSISQALQGQESESLQQPLDTENSSADQENTLLDRLDRAKSSAERDELYFRLALLFLKKDNSQARDYASKIDAIASRKQAQTWVDANLAVNAVKKKRIDAAFQLTRAGALSSLQKVWIFTQAAELLAKSDREKAMLMLENATSEVRHIDGADLDRPRGLFAIAHAVLLIEPGRALEVIFEAIKAANSTGSFTGEGGVLILSARGPNQILNKTVAVPEFDIAGIFAEMASSDYENAVQLARGFQADAPRANATIAISKSILQDRKQSDKPGSHSEE